MALPHVEYHCPEHGQIFEAGLLYFRRDTARTAVCRRCDRPAVLRYKYTVPLPRGRRADRSQGA